MANKPYNNYFRFFINLIKIEVKKREGREIVLEKCRWIWCESGEVLGAWRNQRKGYFLWLLEAKGRMSVKEE